MRDFKRRIFSVRHVCLLTVIHGINKADTDQVLPECQQRAFGTVLDGVATVEENRFSVT
jgi:hypothetical protein